MAASRTEVEARLPEQQQQPHGTKRPASDGLENEQRLSKRFDLLNLDHNGTRLYIPVASSSSQTPHATSQSSPKSLADPLVLKPGPSNESNKPRRSRPTSSSPENDLMQVEDTPHRIYIHDLAAELSDVESDEENPIFLSDIEKHLSKIPKFILAGPEPKATRDNQIVLYSVPTSLTVPEEQDNVRKAIVEARARMREKQTSGVGEPKRAYQSPVKEVQNAASEQQRSYDGYGDVVEEYESDAMEIDDL